MRRILLIIVALLSIIFYSTIMGYEEIGTIKNGGFVIKETDIRKNLLNSDISNDVETIYVEGGQGIYKRGNSIYYGEDKVKIDKTYPVYLNDGQAIELLSGHETLFMKNLTIREANANTIINNGSVYDDNYIRTDSEDYILVRLSNGLYLNPVEIKMDTYAGHYDIPYNSLLYMTKDNIRYYYLFDGVLKSSYIQGINLNTTVRLGMTSYRYGDLLKGLGEIVEFHQLEGEINSKPEYNTEDYDISKNQKENNSTGNNSSTDTINYVVRHFKQNTDGTYPSVPFEQEIFSGKTGIYVSPEVKKYTGFNSPDSVSKELKGSSTIYIDYMYTRSEYHVNIRNNNQRVISNTSGQASYRYEQKVNITADVIEGYKLYISGDYMVNSFVMPAKEVNIYLDAVPLDYKITYSLNGGYVENPNPSVYTIESDSFTLNNPTKNGVEFIGWIGSGITKPSKNVVISTGSYGDRNYTAVFEQDDTVTYKVEHFKQTLSNENALVEIEEIETVNGTTVTPDVKNYQGFIAPAVKTITVSKGGNNTVKYYYSRDSYTLSIDNARPDVVEQVSGMGNYRYESPVTINASVKDGYQLEISGDRVSKRFNMPASDVSVTLSAVPINYRILYVLYDGIAENPVTYNIESGNIVINNPVKEGYVFTGWSGFNGNNEPELHLVIPAGTTGNLTLTANYIEE